jgi:DnaJ-class molecular chaperone
MRLTPSEQLARAYATLDLPPHSSPGEALRQYRRLVKRWHPDRYAGCPVAEAEASQRMREINVAYALVRPTLRRAAARPAPRASATTAYAGSVFGERLRRESVEAIVDAMAGPTMFETLFQLAVHGALIAGGLTLLLLGGRHGKPLDIAMGGAMLAMALSITLRSLLSRSDSR